VIARGDFADIRPRRAPARKPISAPNACTCPTDVGKTVIYAEPQNRQNRRLAGAGRLHDRLCRPLRTRFERPGCRLAADALDELAPPHSITSSARPSSGIGKVIPSALAVLELMTSSKLAGSSSKWASTCRRHSGRRLLP